MPNYRRGDVQCGTYFFTVNLAERKRTLLVDHIDDLRNAVRKVLTDHPFRIDGWVVLPDHLHAVWTLPKGDADYSMRRALIKAVFSRCISADEVPGVETPGYFRQSLRDAVSRMPSLLTVGGRAEKPGKSGFVSLTPTNHSARKGFTTASDSIC